MNDHWTHHPIYTRLVAPSQPFARHALLHDMEVALSRLDDCAGLAARVRHFVDRGIPYFAPNDARYCDWAAKAAALWDEVHERSASEAEPTLY